MAKAEWGEFKIGDLFEIESYTKRFDANKVNIKKNGNYPYVVRMSSNNGQKGYIEEAEKYLNAGNTISFGQDTATMFYQERPYFTGDKIKILKAKENKFGKNNAQFFLTAMSKAFRTFSWGSSSYSVDIIKQQTIFLPITSSNKIDFDFIEEFIAELEERSVTELEAWLRVAGLDNCKLTEEEQQALDNMNRGNVILKEVKIGNLFKIKKGKRLTKANMKPGKIRFIGATSTNNGETAKIANNSHLHSAGALTVTYNGSVGEAFFQDSKFWASDDVNVLYAKHSISKDESLYFLAPLKKKGKSYAYNYKWTKDKMKEDYIILPITPQGEVNYTFMATIISAVKKLVIKDVAHYAQKEIKAAQHVIAK